MTGPAGRWGLQVDGACRSMGPAGRRAQVETMLDEVCTGGWKGGGDGLYSAYRGD